MSNDIPEMRVWLALPHEERQAAVIAAGKLPDGRNFVTWSKEDQLWYAHPGVDRERIKPWLPDRSLRSSGGEPQSEFFDAMTSAGLVLKGLPVMDGKRQRVATVEDKGGKRSGVYRGFLDGRPAGWFINYHRAETEKSVTNWKATGGEADPHVRLHIRAAMRQSQDDAARERAATYAAQTAKAKALYEKLPPADASHPYLMKKGITPTADLRQTRNGALVVPFNDVSGNFRTLQYIPPEGEKYLFTDAPKVGNFLVVGGELRDGDPVIYAEGYATARSLNLASGLPVVMTIDAGNMLNVAQQLKEHYPTSPHVFMADMDLKKDVNKGFLSATSAAELTEGAVLVPPFTSDEVSSGFTDFNDLHHSRGLQGLRDYLESTLPNTLTSINPEKYPMKAPSDPALRTEQLTTDGTESNKKPPARSGSAKEKAPQVHALVAQGVSNAEIAKQLDIGLSSVYRILKTPPAPAEKVSNIDYETGEIITRAESDEQLPTTAAVGTSSASAVGDVPEATSSVGDSQGDVTPADLSKNDTAESANNSNDTQETSVPDLASQAHLLQQQGLSLAQIAASLDIGVSQTHRLLNESAAKDPTSNSAQHETNDTADSSKNETPGVDEFATQFSDISTRMQALLDDSKNLETNEFQSKLLALVSERLSLTGVWMSADAYTFDSGIDTKCLALEDQLKTHLEEVLAAVHSNASSTSNPHEEDAILTGPRRVSPSSEDIPEALKRIDIDKLLSRMTYEEHPDGKSVIYKLDGEAAFTDHGNRLVMAAGASDHEEKVLSALLTAAQHYHGRIELTGSDAFKSYAISLIVAHKLDVTMKVATQQAALDAARREAGQPVAPSDTVAGNPERSSDAQRNDSPPSGSQHRADEPPKSEATSAHGPQAWNPERSSDTQRNDSPASGSQHRAAEPPKSEATSSHEPQTGESNKSDPHVTVSRASQESSASQQPQPEKKHTKEDIHTPAEKAREGVTGKVIACGEAPFRFEKGESESTYITLRTKEGTQTYWGKELAGLLRETRVQPGKMITLQWQGKQPVTVQVPQKNREGIVTHYKPHETNRNQWSMTPLGGERVLTGSDEMVKLSAFDANRFTQVQQDLVTRLQITMPAPPSPADGLYWLRPDGQGSQNSGDALSASRPAHNDKAGERVMSAWGADGRPDLYLVQGDGDYLQGVIRREGEFQHVLVSLPDNKESPPMVFNLITPDGAVPIGSGNGINRSHGTPVPREFVVLRLQGEEQQRIAKLDAPQDMPPSMHARLGFDERWKAEAGFPKDRPVAAPQVAPVAPVSPQRPA